MYIEIVDRGQLKKRRELQQLILILASSLLLVSKIGGIVSSIILIAMSFFMYSNPVSFIPLIFVSAWHIGMVVVPGFAAIFYYSLIFLVSASMNSYGFNHSKIIKPLRTAMLFGVWLLISGAFAITGNWYESFKIFMYILIAFLCSKIRINSMDFVNKSIVCIAVVMSVYFFVVSYIFPLKFSLVDRSQYTNSDITDLNTIIWGVNPNTAAQIVLIVFAILFCYSLSKRKFGLLCISLLNFATLIFLGSRTSFFTVAFVSAVYFFFVSKMNGVKKLGIGLFLLIVAFGVFYYSDGVTSRVSRLNANSIIEDGGSGRFMTWEFLINDVIPNYLFSGIGVGRDNYRAIGLLYDADNVYFDVLTQTGVIGLFLFLKMLMETLRDSVGKLSANKNYHFLIFILYSYLLIGVGESIFDIPIFWGVFLYYCLAVSNRRPSAISVKLEK